MRYVIVFLIIALISVTSVLTAGVISRVKLYTDKEVYYLGEQVRIVFENKSKKTVYLPNPAPWTILDKEGKPVYAPTAIQVITPVKPGERKEWVWNQTAFENVTVTVGSYQVVLRTVSQVYYAYFKIIEKPPEEKKVRFWGVTGPFFVRVWKWSWADWDIWSIGDSICCYGRIEGANFSYKGVFVLKVKRGLKDWGWFGNILSWVEGEGYVEDYADEIPVIVAETADVERIEFWRTCWGRN